MATPTALRQIIFIDPKVPDLQALLKGVAPDAEVVVLDAGQDGVQQIADYLVANDVSDLSAIQIVSHGSEGSITLGSTVLDRDNVESHADALAQIGAALAPDGDIMLYGCDVASGTIGQQFINTLASLTGADVAASTNLTGAAALGGDWILEASTGAIETAPAFTAAAQADFNALLATNVLAPTAPEFTVQSSGSSNGGPAIAALSGGGYVIVWFNLENADGNGGAIFGQIFNNNNQKVGAQFQVNSSGIFNDNTAGGTSQLSQIFPSVTALSDGGFVVGWQTFVDGTNGSAIDAQRFKVGANGPIYVNAAGNTVAAGTHTEFRVSTLEPADSVAVSVTGRPDGGFVFTWTDSIDNALDNNFGNGYGYDIRARAYTAAGAAGAEATVNVVTANQQVAPDVASQSDGSSVVIWQALNHVGDASLWGMYARKIDANGVPQGAADIQLNTTVTNQQGAGSIAALSDINNDGIVNDGYIVVWTSLDQNNNNGHIFGRRLDTNGNVVGSEFQIDNPTPGLTKFAPSVVALSDGTFVVNWAVSDTGQIIGRRFDANGAGTPIATTGEVVMNSVGLPGGKGDTPLNALEGPTNLYGFWAIYYAGHDSLAALTDGSLIGVWGTRPQPFQNDITARDFTVSLGTPNHAPDLDATKTPLLNNVPEGFAKHSGTPIGALGTLVSDLVDLNPPPGGLDNVTDADAGAVTGIAITALDTTHGDWWYTTDGGANWTQIVNPVSPTAALALVANADTRIFFVADSGFDGVIQNAITFRAWDQSIGANGSVLNASAGGGTSAFSTNTDTANITVDPANETPTFTGAGSTRSFTEGGGLITLETNFAISDSDDPDLAGAKVEIKDFVAGDELRINGDLTGTFGANISFSFSNGVLTLTGHDSFANYVAALEAVQFQHLGDNPTNFDASLTRTIDWQVDDGHVPTGSLFTLFNPPSDLTAPGWAETPRDVEVADFNGDGKLDFVAAMSESSANRFNLVVELGNGDGTFGQKQIYQIAPVGSGEIISPRDVGLQLGFFNNDALLDIAVTSSYTDQVFVFLGAANGKFTPQSIPPTNAPLPPGYGTGGAPKAIASADFDHDNKADLVVGNSDFFSISFMKGNGNGTFAPDPLDFMNPSSLHGLGGISGIVASDVDGDGNADIVAAGDIGVSVLFGNGDGTFDQAAIYAAGTSPAGITVADLNKDGRPDIVVANAGSNNVSVLLQKVDHTFEDAVSYASGGLLPKTVQVQDFNGDGNVDLAIANSGSDADPHAAGFNPDLIDRGNVAILLGAGDGTFSPLAAEFGGPSFDVGSGPRSLAIADIDHDGKTDIVAPNFYDHTVSVLFNNSQFTSVLHTTINITAVNDPPDVTAPTQLAGVPSVALLLDGIVFADLDGGAAGQTETATFTAPSGFFTANTTVPGVAVNGDGTGTLTLTGTLADLNAFISGDQLSFTGATDTTVHIVIDDLGHTGSGGAQQGEADIVIDFNEAPVIGNTGPAVTYTELAAPVLIDPDLTVTDGDNANLDHASVKITNGSNFFDQLKINGATSGTIGNISFGYSSATRTLSLFGSDTVENYQAALDLVTFNNTSQNPTNSGFSPSRTITWLVNDGASDSAPATTTINIDPINSQPALTDVQTPLTYTEGTLQAIGFDAFFSDVDNFAPGSGTITISDGHLSGDRITYAGIESGTDFSGAIQFNYNAATGVFTFTTIDFSSADYESFFSRLRYSFRDTADPTKFGDDPSAAGTDLTRTLTWQVDDGSGAANSLSDPVDQIINISAINDAPVITIPQGTLDIITANFNSGDVSALLGDGLGGFTPLPPHAAANSATSVALGDLDGDGRLDVVVASETGVVSVSLGDGLGGFGSQTSYPVAGQASAVALGDVNNDGKLDIVSANKSTDDVSVLLGDGLGGFGLQTPHQVGDEPSDIALGDLNNDGKLDIVTANMTTGQASGDVSILLGDGLGGFTAQTPPTVGGAPVAVALGDLNGDGFLDIVTANSADNNVSILFNNNSGGISFGFTLPVGINPSDVALGDVTGDGKLDIVVANNTDNNVTIIPGTGFGSFFASFTVSVDVNPTSVAVGDLNGDGKLDIVTTHTGGNNLTVLLADGVGGFTSSTQSIGAGDGPVSAALGDLDNALVVDEDTDLSITGLSITDADAGSGTLTAALQVANGILTVAPVGGAVVGGSTTGTVTITGTLVQINATLSAADNVVYTGNLDFNGFDTLTITANDGGNTGDGGALTATKLVPINVNAVNDAPTLDLDGNDDTATGADFQIQSTPAGAAVAIADADMVLADVDDTNIESATITITNDKLNDQLTITGALPAGIVASGEGTATLTLTGSASKADYQAALQQVQYSNPGPTPDLETRDITVVVNDGNLDSNTAHAFVAFGAPTANPTSGSGLEDQPDRIAITLSGTDPDGSVASFEIETISAGGQLFDAPTGGTLLSVGSSVPATGTGPWTALVYFQPNADFKGATSFTYSAFDGTQNGAPATASIDVTSLNDAPVGADASRKILEEQPYTFSAADFSLTDAHDNPANTLAAVVITTSPLGGVLTLSGGAVSAGQTILVGDLGNLVFTPTANLNGLGAAGFTFQVKDNGGTLDGGVDTDQSPNTFTFDITSVNDRPEGTANTVTTNEDTAYTFTPADFGFSDPNDTPADAFVFVELTTLPAVGSLKINGVTVTVAGTLFSVTNGDVLTYEAPADSNGAGLASFTFQVQDAGGTAEGGVDLDQPPKTMTINVTAVADLIPDARTIDEDAAVDIDVMANDGFSPPRELTSFTQGAHGVVTRNDHGTAQTGDDTLVYTPFADFNGTDQFTYVVTSGSGAVESTTVDITVNAIADIAADLQTTNEDTAVNINVLGNDNFENSLRALSSFGQGTHGTVTRDTHGSPGEFNDDTLIYTPNPDFHGTDSFTYTVTSNGVTETATVSVAVNSVTDAFDDSTVSVEDHVTTFNVLANDTFSDPAAAITGVTQGAHGSVAIGANGNVVYTPDANFRGADLFTYTVTAGGLTETANVHIDMVLQAAPPPGTAPVDGDFQADRFGDLFVYQDSGPSAIWQMREDARLDSGTNLPNNGPTWHAKAFTDLDSTGGFSDIVWQNDDGSIATWQMQSVNKVGEANLPNPGPATHVRDAQDFDGNGGGDILLQNDNGALTIWMMQDATHILPNGQISIDQNPGAPWKAAVAGDFNGDGQAGILFVTANGDTAIWEDYATSSPGHGRFDLQVNLQSNGPTWHVKAAADFDGDNKDDILWQNDNGQAAIWLMDGLQIKDGYNIAGTAANGPTWHIIDARDMNHDSRADLLFQNDIGQVALWENFTPTSGTTAAFDTQLNIVPELNPTGHLVWHIL